MKTHTVTVKNNENGDITTFDTKGMLGAFINKEFGEGNSDTSQFMLGKINSKELIKLLAGCINMAYFATNSSLEGDKIIEMAHHIAKEGFKQKENYREGL